MNGNGRKYKMGGGRMFFGKSRSEKKAMNNLGIIHSPYSPFGIEERHHRSNVLKTVDDYLHGNQYKGLRDWDDSVCTDMDSYVKLKDRKPKIIFPFAKVFQDRMASKLAGQSTFPKFKIEDDEEADHFLNNILIKGSFFRANMQSLAKDLMLRTSAFVRFRFSEGNLQYIKYNTNYCYPEFDDGGELETVTVKYIYDTDEQDPQTGRMIRRWFKLDLGKMADIEYDNPIYHENQEPEFQVVEKIDHELGFVQGEWFRIGESQHSPDGEEDPIIYQMCEFIDCLNYNLSLSDQAVNYGTEPQLAITGIDSEDADKLIKAASKTWLMGREGKAEFLETSGGGVETASKQREDYLKYFQHIARIVLLDPEKLAGNAQSGKAMEIMHGPMVELINEVRPWMEKGMIKLLEKVAATVILLNSAGFETQFILPPRWQPQSLAMEAMWPPIFELTTQDKQQILSIALQASNGNIISRDTALKWLQSQGVDFGVEDFDLEQQKVNTQQQFNTFGF
jgi:hypothetical protein